ncbi:MAG: hypothetical protein AB7I18_11910 [Candidatus Berkiella sp.]
MGATRDNLLQQQIDISGSTNPSQSLILSEEKDGYGARIPGQDGYVASILSKTGDQVTLIGLTGMVADSAGRFLTVTGAASAGNNGTFEIITYLSSSSVVIINAVGIAPDANNGSLTWIERNSYMLEDDINYIRTDRKEIKGTSNWYDTPPPYTRPDDTGTNVPINLTNISGKTTDAVAYPGSREFFGAGVIAGQTKVTITSVGNLKHTDSINTLGIPCFDVAPFVGDFRTCFVKILDATTSGTEFTVLSGPHAGERIFGVTNNGSSVSPDSVEVLFYSCPMAADISTSSTPYTWEVGQTNSINLVYAYNQRMDGFDFNIFRFDLTIPSGTSSGGGFLTPTDHQTLRQLIHFMNEGPANGFLTGAYKEILPVANPFPTSIIWWESSAKLKKIVEKTYIYNPNKTPATISWAMYAVDGITVIATVSDAITYSGVFETSRLRTIS